MSIPQPVSLNWSTIFHWLRWIMFPSEGWTSLIEWSDSPSNDLNITCNTLVTRNQTLITIQRGWEGIPESIVLNLIICLVRISVLFWTSQSVPITVLIIFNSLQTFIVIFVIIRHLARRRQKRYAKEHTNASDDEYEFNSHWTQIDYWIVL